MTISLDDIKQLCLEGESSRLDYKRDQYPFEGVPDPKKVELFKDILAMANAFRSQPAYILIGVEQQDDGTGKVTGIAKDRFIDDANLQQFINFKTNKQIDFISYSVPVDDDKIVQVIEIPVQKERPYYPVRRFVGINEHAVWVRAGSSSHEALPEEIAQMGRDDQIRQNQRIIDISLIVPGNEIGNINFRAFEISRTGDPPVEPPHSGFDVTSLSRPIPFLQKFSYIHDIFRTMRIDVGLENKSSLSAEKIEIESFISQCSNECVRQIEHFPTRPSEYPLFNNIVHPNAALLQPQELHPGKYDSSFVSLYFEVMHDGAFTLDITVLGKDMQPIKKQFHIDVKLILNHNPLSPQNVEDFFTYFEDEDDYWNFRYRAHNEKGNNNACPHEIQ